MDCLLPLFFLKMALLQLFFFLLPLPNDFRLRPADEHIVPEQQSRIRLMDWLLLTPQERERLEALLSTCTPRTSSLRLALTFTTKVTMLMQRQNDLEMATNRISSAISSTLELEPILQAAVEEVGRALNVRRAALVLWQEGTKLPEGMSVYERSEQSNGGRDETNSHLNGSGRGAVSTEKRDLASAGDALRTMSAAEPESIDRVGNAAH